VVIKASDRRDWVLGFGIGTIILKQADVDLFEFSGNGEKAGVIQNPMLEMSWPQARLWRERSVAVGVQSKRSEESLKPGD